MIKNIKKYNSFLFFIFWIATSNAQTSPENTRAIASASFDKLEASERWVDSFSNEDLVELPVGVRKTINNTQYAIGITKATFSAEYTTLTVFCKIDLPQTDKNGKPIQLFFGAEDIKLSHAGGIIGDAKLVLLGDVEIPFNENWQVTLSGGFDMRTGTTQDLTYVTIDCEGFKNLKITGSVDFSRNLIIPLELDGQVNEAKTTITKTYYNGVTKQVPNRVKGDFSLQASSWNDILVSVNLQPFVLKAKQNGKNYDSNYQFIVGNAVLDLSDLNNHPSVNFPEYYNENDLLMPNPNTWRGVFVETFELGLPKEFKTTDTVNQGSRIRIGASNLIIDKFGVSGTFYGDNIFPLEKGVTGDQKSWAYSLDHIDVTIAANTFVKANLKGQILLPISKMKPDPKNPNKKFGLEYIGFISQQEQQLTVVTKDSISFDLWKAKALILPNSSVTLGLVDGKFLPKANLNGSLSIGTNKAASDEKDTIEGKKSVDFKGITFEGLRLQTISPIIQVDNMGYKGKVSFGNFPVSISNINVSMANNSSRIDFDLGINLMESVGASATARIGIKGKMTEENFKQSWKYDGLDLSAISIKAEFSGFKMSGGLILMENDPVYGNGFSADLDVEVTGVVNVTTKAMFGRSTFRYWYFDASAKLDAPPAPFMINGFGGGASYKMRLKDGISPNETQSGLTYVPDESYGLGLKALIYFSIGKEEVCDGEAGMEISFNTNGGVNRLAIFGKAGIMAKLPGLKDVRGLMGKVAANANAMKNFLGVSDASLSGSFASKFLPKAKELIPDDLSAKTGINVAAAIEFDFQNNSFHGTFDVFINTPGGILEGIGAGGRAGWAVFHKDPKDWYIYIGTPDDRCGIKIGLAGAYLKTTSYFMIGTELPGSPPPPDIVAQILGVDAQQLNYMRDENTLANGGGFAFGSSLDFDTGNINFLIFYARFQAGIGFDIMLKDYGEARCSNTGSAVGINGWYANGQAYAYLQGELGVRVKLLFVNIKVPIISAGAAILLQAKLPNPFWMRGYVGGHMNVLGGLIKGRFRFKLTIGEECVFENAAPLGGIKLITDLSPKKDSKDIDVFAVPEATFAMKVNENIIIPEDSGDQTYKIILEKFKVYDGTKEILGNLIWSSTKDRANFESIDALPPQKKLKVVVEVSFQKMVNGVFQPIKVNGQLAKETEERDFTTGSAPNYIPLSNIQYCYPLVNQKYFLEEEYGKGYIQLKRGQDYLFDNTDANWKTEVKFKEDGQNNVLNANFTYDKNINEVSYIIPDINQNTNYSFAIVSKKNNELQPINQVNTSTTNINDSDNDITITTNNATLISKDGEIERIGYKFSTSKYKTFLNKMYAIENQSYNFGPVYSDVIYLSNTINSQEAFEVADLAGTIYSDSKPLINATATLQDDYYTIDIGPNIYNSYPFGGTYEITNRILTEFGNPPSKALRLNNYYMMSIENDVNQDWTKSNFPFEYNLPLIYKQDWVDLYNQIINDQINGIINTSHPAYGLINKDYLFMRVGFYNIAMKYDLPGNKNSNTFYYRFKNENRFR